MPMPSMLRVISAKTVIASMILFSQAAISQQEQASPSVSLNSASQQGPDGHLSIEEIRSLLDSIDPYLPKAEIQGEVDVFGSTSMDTMAHGWVQGFKKFHPKVEVVISAEGSETVFDRLLKNPGAMCMLSRPVTEEDIARLKAEGLKNPVAIQVARDALGVFVHQDNPLETISYPQLVALFCSDDPTSAVTWSAVGGEGELADKAVEILGRNDSSGTRKFVDAFLFHGQNLRANQQELDSNAEVIKAIAANPQAIGIVDFSCASDKVKRLHLRENSKVIPDNDHEVLLGHYPIMRPMTLVFDLGQQGEQAAANREFARYALSQAGQIQAILSGFYPFAPPTLRAEMEKLDGKNLQVPTNTASKDQERK